jgi:hypothetical protein
MYFQKAASFGAIISGWQHQSLKRHAHVANNEN